MPEEDDIKTEFTPSGQANNILEPTPEAVVRAVDLLQSGQVIGLPTETVYGLAGDGLNPEALARIFNVKRRPTFDPLILHFIDADSAFLLASHVPDSARELARRFWPGPLTLVLPKEEVVPDLATSGLPTVALRVPVHPIAQIVLRAFAGPLAAPSANRFGRISPTDAAAVSAELGDEVPLILDGGPCPVGVESTVVDLSGDQPVLLRAGGLSVEQIETVTGPLERARPVDDRPRAPGQLKHHYAPRKPLYLMREGAEIPDRTEIGWLGFGPPPAVYSGVMKNLSFRGDLAEAAANFFRYLRDLDNDPRVSVIFAVPLPAQGLGLAINERLDRASAAHRGK